jgi:hypothetical protein
MRREVAALLAAAAILLAGAIGFLVIDRGTETTPAQRAEEQNSGANAPSETVPSPGTVEDPQGDPALPPEQSQ